MHERSCACGRAFMIHERERNRRKWCSEACRLRAYRERNPRPPKPPKPKRGPTLNVHACVECAHEFLAKQRGGSAPSYCSHECRLRREARRFRRDRDKERERRLRAAWVEEVDRVVVFERDGWTCQLCGELCDRDAQVPDRRAPTVDHVIPLARGGLHSYANVQTAHLSCNASKGARLAA